MTQTTTTKTRGIEWVVMADARVASLHHTSSGARRAVAEMRRAGYPYPAKVLATIAGAPFALAVGDRCTADGGAVYPA